MFMISDSRLVPIAFIDVAYRLLLPPPLVSFCEGKDHAVAAALAPFLLILLKSGPTNNGETLLSFSRSLTERFLIFFLPPSLWAASKLSVQREAFVDPHILAHIPKRKQKKARALPFKLLSTYHTVCRQAADEESDGCSSRM